MMPLNIYRLFDYTTLGSIKLSIPKALGIPRESWAIANPGGGREGAQAPTPSS